jgi:hemerythrin superfamily protein
MSHDGDVLQILETDHREVEEMYTRLQALPSGDAGRKELADEIITELVRHSIAEETYVYPVIREKLVNGGERADKETAEHAEAERLMKDLEKVGADDPEFDHLVSRLMSTILGHIADEETSVFPELRAACSQEELDKLATKVNAIKKIAPTHPHPAQPDSPIAHKLLGPAVGLVDRVRDLVTSRTT